MNRFKALLFGNVGYTKPVLTAVLTVGAFLSLTQTQAGQSVLSQFGLKDAVAQTMGAAGQAMLQTSNALKDFLGRSPGERGTTDLLKGKSKSAGGDKQLARAEPTPVQRALGKIFDQPVEDVASLGALPPVVSLADEIVNAVAPGSALPPLASGPGIFIPGTGSGGGGGGGGTGGGPGGGGGGGGGVIITPPPVPPVINAVPEPSTWALLILGFGAIGASIRRANVTSRRAKLCARS